MKVIVHHREMTESGMFGNNKAVAVVDAPDDLTATEAMSYAFRWTNNVEGSWSKPETFRWMGEIIENGDYNERVKFIAEAHPEGYGERSTSVGDLMYIGFDCYEVMPNGFRQIKEAA